MNRVDTLFHASEVVATSAGIAGSLKIMPTEWLNNHASQLEITPLVTLLMLVANNPKSMDQMGIPENARKYLGPLIDIASIGLMTLLNYHMSNETGYFSQGDWYMGLVGILIGAGYAVFARNKIFAQQST